MPNLQRIKILVNGSPRRVQVCTTCIKSGRVVRAV
jgi:large subunit ribosomal protein L28